MAFRYEVNGESY